MCLRDECHLSPHAPEVKAVMSSPARRTRLRAHSAFRTPLSSPWTCRRHWGQRSPRSGLSPRQWCTRRISVPLPYPPVIASRSNRALPSSSYHFLCRQSHLGGNTSGVAGLAPAPLLSGACSRLVLQTGAQIGLDYLLVLHDLRCRALRENFALRHHDHRSHRRLMKSISCSIMQNV